jgi:hypothetical protein
MDQTDQITRQTGLVPDVQAIDVLFCRMVFPQPARPQIRFSVQQPSASLAPFDGAESGASEEGVGEVEGSHRLRRVGQVGIVGIPLRRDVPEGDGMAVIHAHGEGRRPAGNVLRSPILGGSQAAHVVLVRGYVEHGPVAEDETEFEQRRNDSRVHPSRG